ncbi:CCA tRNA nucleotidyltransferase [Legionella fairfieldensis]|uniref:CCA tRNA nucleotidyltransferase n=1 Tax=Legionella fairfieldensis TaxID=45064 RepID=UPI00048F59E8|nr:CCA tRNA nucleotidyltransferase [Legionella fairfieldensis]
MREKIENLEINQTIRSIVDLVSFGSDEESFDKIAVSVCKILKYKVDNFPTEEKVLLLIRIGFILLIPGINFLPEIQGHKTEALYERATSYFKKVETLLPLLSENLVSLYTDLIEVANFFISSTEKQYHLLIQEKYKQVTSRLRKSDSKYSKSNLLEETLDKLIDNHQKILPQEVLIPTLLWNHYACKKILNHNNIFKDYDLTSEILNIHFEILAIKVCDHHQFIEGSLLSAIEKPLSPEATNLKCFLNFSIDVLEISWHFPSNLKSDLYKDSLLRFMVTYKLQQEYLQQLNDAIESAKLQAERLSEELLRIERIKEQCLKRRAPVTLKKNNITQKGKKASSSKKSSVKSHEKKEKSKLTPIEKKDLAYALYKQGQFQEAIKLCEDARIPQEKISKKNRLEQVEILGCLGDQYKAWSQNLKNKNNKLISTLEKKALSYYNLAIEQITLGLVEHQDDSSLYEWLALSDFFQLAVNSLQSCHYIHNLKKEAEEDKPVYNEPVKLESTSHDANLLREIKVKNDVKTKLDLLLTEKKQTLLKELYEHGHESFFIGGAVRNSYLNQPSIGDTDIVTSAHPQLVKDIAKKIWGETATIMLVGLYNPVVRIIIPSSNEALDIAPLQGLSPSNVVPVQLDNGTIVYINQTNSLIEDCQRRDFNFNCVYYNPRTQSIIDPTGRGLHELDKKILNTVINPYDSFTEDELRKYRAIRFAIKYNFKISEGTERALQQHAAQSKGAAPPRLLIELHKSLFNDKGLEAFSLLERYGLLDLFKKTEKEKTNKSSHNFELVSSLLKIIISNKKLSENNAWLLFLAGLLWPHIQYASQNKEVIKSNINNTILLFYPFLRFDNIHLKIKQIWLQTVDNNLPITDLAVEEVELIDIFKQAVQPLSAQALKFFTHQKTIAENTILEACSPFTL